MTDNNKKESNIFPLDGLVKKGYISYYNLDKEEIETEKYEETFTISGDYIKNRIIAMIFIEEMKYKIEESSLRKEILEEKIRFIDNEKSGRVAYLFKTIYNTYFIIEIDYKNLILFIKGKFINNIGDKENIIYESNLPTIYTKKEIKTIRKRLTKQLIEFIINDK